MAAHFRLKPTSQVVPFTGCMAWIKTRAPAPKYTIPVPASVNFQNLGLSGLSTSCDSNTGYFRKVFWGSLWLAALSWCVFEIIMSMITFVSSPFSVDVKYKENHTMIAPYVTLCPADFMFRNPAVSRILLKERFCNTSYKNPLELLSKCNMSIDNLWDISRFEFGDVFYRLFQANNWLDGIPDKNLGEIEVAELVTMHGICLILKDGVIHSEAEIPFIQYAGTTGKGFYGAYNHLTIMALDVQQLIHVNTWQNPCQSDEGHISCMLNCTEAKIIAKSKLKPCRLPYMGKRLDFPACKSESEFLNMFTATQSALNEVNPENCSCLKSCNRLRYREDYFLTYQVKHLFGFYMVIPSCDIEVIEDQLTYGFTSFLSGVGGHLGLFLGLSILSIMEILEAIFWKTASMGHLFLTSIRK